MTLPRKGSRLIDVDGRQFRFVVNRVKGPAFTVVKKDVAPSRVFNFTKGPSLSVTVEDATSPGCVFNYTWPDGCSVLPNDVRENIRAALKQGWSPRSKGPAFRISEIYFPAHPHNN